MKYFVNLKNYTKKYPQLAVGFCLMLGILLCFGLIFLHKDLLYSPTPIVNYFISPEAWSSLCIVTQKLFIGVVLIIFLFYIFYTTPELVMFVSSVQSIVVWT